jgi:hypothetical protein
MTVAEEVSSTELFPDAIDHAAEWTRSVHLWISQLRPGEWNGVTKLLRADRDRDPDEKQSVRLTWRGSASTPRAEPMWARDPKISGVVTDYTFIINYFRSAELLCEWDTDVVVTALSGPGTLFTRLIPYYMHRDDQLRSVTTDLLHASLFHVNQTRLEERIVVYDRLVDFAKSPYLYGNHVVLAELEVYLLQLLVNDELVTAEYVDKITVLAVAKDPRGPENLALFLRLLVKAEDPRSGHRRVFISAYGARHDMRRDYVPRHTHDSTQSGMRERAGTTHDSPFCSRCSDLSGRQLIAVGGV